VITVESPKTKAVCDDCNKEFEVDIHTLITDNHIEKNFFNCPHCGKEYIAFCTNQSIRQKQAEIKKLWRDLRVAKTVKQHDKIHSKIDSLEEEIKNEMSALRLSIVTH
jgi:transcription elongation factor Elf1